MLKWHWFVLCLPLLFIPWCIQSVQLVLSSFSIYCTETIVKDYNVFLALFQTNLWYHHETGPHSTYPLTYRKQLCMHQMNREWKLQPQCRVLVVIVTNTFTCYSCLALYLCPCKLSSLLLLKSVMQKWLKGTIPNASSNYKSEGFKFWHKSS
jgi:hypothetical protein